jgi:hypothetical protein
MSSASPHRPQACIAWLMYLADLSRTATKHAAKYHGRKWLTMRTNRLAIEPDHPSTNYGKNGKNDNLRLLLRITAYQW